MNLMDQDHPVHRFFNTIGDVVLLNLLFLLCCIPVITIGPALTALFHCTLRIVKGSLDGAFSTFFSAFRQNFLQALAAWLLFLAAALILVSNLRFLESRPAGRPFYLMSGFPAALLAIYFLYVFPVIAAFSNRLFPLIKNAYAFALLHFPSTAVMAFLTIFPMYMTYQDLQLMPLYACCWFFFGFSLTALANSLLLYRIFRPYLT